MRMKNKKILILVCSVVILFGLSILMSVAAEAQEKKLTFVVALNAGMIPFWVPGRTGAMDAGEKFGVNVEWIGPPTPDVNALISLLENVITRKVDGIVIQAPNYESMASTIEKIQAAGIPVIAVNNPLGPLTYVGQDHVTAGETIGKELIKALSGEGDWAEYWKLPKREPAGKVVFYIDVPGQVTLEARMQGYKNATKDYPAIQFVNVFDVTTRGSAAAKRVVEDAMTGIPDLAAHASTVGMGTAMAGQVVKEKGLVPKVVVVGWDLLTQTLELIKEGAIAATIGQDPYMQGFESVRVLYEYVALGKPLPANVDSGSEIVTIKNVDVVIAREAKK
jgi:ABC-type sugar transport system substrate-binding protein